MASRSHSSRRRNSDIDFNSYGTLDGSAELRELPESLYVPAVSDPYSFCSQFKRLLRMAWPITIIQITQYSFGFVASIFCGQFGTAALDTVALANSAINVVGISIAVGLSSACDTLFAQIYGSSNKKLMGAVVQRSVIILLLALLPCIAIHINAEPIMLLLGQDRAVAKMTGEYLFIFLPGLSSFFLYIVVSKYLMAQGIILPTMVFGLVANGVNALLHYILMLQYDMDTNGSAYAQSSSYVLMCVLNLGFILISGAYEQTWDGWTLDCLYDWGTFFKLAVAGLLMLCIKWWAFEVGIFLSGILGTVDLAAQTIVFQYETIYLMFPLGIAVATSISIGQYLGGGRVEGAKMATKVGLIMAAAIGIVFSAIFAAGNELLPKLISSDKEVVKKADPVLYILAVYAIFSALSICCGGVLGGIGKQQAGAVIVAVGYFIALVIGIPTMFLTSLGIQGFWIGLAIALTLSAILYLIIIKRTKWQAMAEKANQRSKRIQAVSVADENHADPLETTGLLESGVSSSVSSDIFTSYERSVLLSPEGAFLRSLSSNISSPYLEPFPAPCVQLEVQRPACTLAMVCSRLLYVFVCLSVLAAGICCRLLIPPPMLPLNNATTIEPPSDNTTTTLMTSPILPIINSTTLKPSIDNTTTNLMTSSMLHIINSTTLTPSSDNTTTSLMTSLFNITTESMPISNASDAISLLILSTSRIQNDSVGYMYDVH